MVRPTADRVREALFSTLGRRVEGSRVLDLYAGAGTLGIEALSRGAAHAVFVERSAHIARVLAGNLAKCDLGERARVIVMKVTSYLGEQHRDRDAFDLIFLDPPYRISDAEVEGALNELVERGFLAGGGLVVLERASRAPTTSTGRLVLRTKKTYGDTQITIFEERAISEE